MEYPVNFNPYEWHDHHKPNKPRWRVKAGQAERRLALCNEFDALNESWVFNNPRTFAAIDKWHALKQAILACEETEQAE